MKRTSTDANAHAGDNNDRNQESKRRRRDPGAGETEKKEVVRRKKRKVALFLGYEGSAYHGMQKNPGVKTIEGLLEAAICAVGGISQENRGNFMKTSWSRAARTDKGVSAVAQCVSLKMACEVKGKLDESLIQAINEKLPDDIRCYGFTRATAAFKARTDCHRRLYEYLMPLRTLGGPNSPLTSESEEKDKEDETINCSHLPKEKEEPSTQEQQQNENSDQQSTSKQKGYQEHRSDPQEPTCSDPRIIKFNKILAQYEGTHSFHNFTDSSLTVTDAGKRYLVSVRAEGPFRIGSVYYISVHILGQSFIMYQIRKMIGLALHIFHGHCPPETLRLALSEDVKFSTPTAPATGLLLNTLYFEMYNNRHKKHLSEPITAERWREQMDQFKHEHIYRHIARTESVSRTMAQWLKTSVASAKYDQESILAQWNNVREDNPESPAAIRRARIRQRYPVLTAANQTQLSQSEIDHMKELFVRAFFPEEADKTLESKCTSKEDGEKTNNLSRKELQQALSDGSLKGELGPDFLVCVPHGLFVLGPPPHPETPALGLAVPPYLTLAVGIASGQNSTIVDPRLSHPVLLRPTGIRMATTTEDEDFTQHSRAMAAAWKALAAVAPPKGREGAVTNIVVRPPPKAPPTPQIADMLAMMLVCARANNHFALKHKLADMAAQIFCERQRQHPGHPGRAGQLGLAGFLACFAMCSDRQALVLYDPCTLTTPADLYPLTPSTRFFFIADAAPVPLADPLPALSPDLKDLASLLAHETIPESAIDTLISCAQVETSKLREEFRKLGEAFANCTQGIRTEADCVYITSILRYMSTTKTLTSAHPRLLAAKDIGSAMNRIHGWEPERVTEKDEVHVWCVDNGAAGARRVGENEMVTKETGILCVVDDEEVADFKEKAERRWGSNLVRSVEIVDGAFVLKKVRRMDQHASLKHPS